MARSGRRGGDAAPAGAERPRPFAQDNDDFEAWLKSRCQVVKADLRYKHERMTEDPFVFLRATFFRWARRIESICPKLADAPAVLSVGDAHTENFGTWRDAEGRLVWGVNDFDEAARIPYPFDLVRLAASALLAPKHSMRPSDIAAAILKGYRRGLADPRPTLLDEQETWMRPYVACTDKERAKFWDEAEEYPAAKPPRVVVAGLIRHLPPDATRLRFASRRKGGGSLGRPRFVVVAVARGGRVVREAKALVPSAWDWAHGDKGAIRFLELARSRYRSPDPFLDVRDGFIYRRIAPDARKVDLGKDRQLSGELLTAMGFDLGAVHAADRRRGAVADDLDSRPRDWLRKAAKAAVAAVEADYAAWRRR